MNYHCACSNLTTSEEEVGWRWEKVIWRRRRCNLQRCGGLRRLLLVLSGGSAPFSIQTPASVFFSCSVFFLFSHFCLFFVLSSLFLLFSSSFLCFFFLCLSLFSTILFLLPKSSPLSIHLKMFPPHYMSFVPLKTHRLFLQIFLPPCSACWAGYL